MKFMQVVAHTRGGEVRSAPEQVTERDYDSMKEVIESISVRDALTFNTESGYVVIPSSQIYYVEIILS